MDELLWYCPVPRPYYVTQTFAQHPYYGKGTDFGGDNLPVFNMRPGRVSLVENRYYFPGNRGVGYANRVVVDHGNWNGKPLVSWHAHLRQNTQVAVGNLVKTGQLLGYTNNTGSSTGPHVHSEARLGNAPYNFFPDMVYTVEEVERMPPVPVDAPVIPKLPVYRVLAQPWLNIRLRPGKLTKDVGDLPYNKRFSPISYVMLGDEMWFQIGYDQYVAAYAYGKWLVELVEE
jgi:murein DD-endopeptidase MepM/ murein hydrolase activator NlpD